MTAVPKMRQLPIVFRALDLEDKTRPIAEVVCPLRADVMTVGNCGRCRHFRRIDFTPAGEPILCCAPGVGRRVTDSERGIPKCVHDLVRVPVVCVAPDTELAVVLPYLGWTTHLEAIPVLGWDGRPLGFFSVHEARRLYAAGVPLDTEIWELMSRALVCVLPETSLFEAKRLVEEAGALQLFAVSADGTFVGVVHGSDLLVADA